MSADPITYLNDIPGDVARRAHGGTSFVPENRGEQEQQSYANTLASDYVALARLATTDEKRATLAEEFPRYRTGYRLRYLAHLEARSRCMSTMITGGSNFPTARNNKRNATSDKRTMELIEFRERALTAIRKALTPELAPIMAGDDDATDRLAAKIAKAEALQARMKDINAVIRKHANAGTEAQVVALMALGCSDATARATLAPDAMGRIGIPTYELTNNAANIRSMRKRLGRVSFHKTLVIEVVKGEHARFEDNPGDNRVRLFYPGKPDAEVRERLKGAGFRWAPSLGCWQAYRNDRTIAAARRGAGSPLVTGNDEFEPESSVETAEAEARGSGVCTTCKGTGEVYTAGQVTVECECVPTTDEV